MAHFFRELGSFCTFYVLNASIFFQNAQKMIIVLYDQRPVACAVLPFLK
tara:strand:- start:219 stop:365 length:147 start_codon:yes stop_codon:yes gene_type:complete